MIQQNQSPPPFITNRININELYNIALTNPSILNTVDICDILKDVDEKIYEKMKNMSLSVIFSEIKEVLDQFQMTENEKDTWISKLKGYRHIDEIHDLEKGKYIRWIRIQTNRLKLTNGSYISDIKFTDNGTHILTINKGRFIQYKFDDCITFQKMTEEEQMILFLRDKYDLQF